MNIKQTAWIWILVVSSMGLFGVESANAKKAETEAPTTASSTDISQSSQVTIAQLSELVTPITATWELTYSAAGIVHKSILRMNGYSGTMRTRFFNIKSFQTEAVDQTMYLKPHPEGLLIVGYNPVYAGTRTPHPIYSPDNFFFSISPDDDQLPIFITCDDRKRCSPVSVKRLR
ncbi:hypothetical protein I8752_01940 [Nostocaceae cyanobacterium CENA369]|uniref:Uncharacterized protein n=1 Tax=Dendronalium phyllosphericum CENA369 TaxID=1725256 RepID=A0A8J7I1I3_9NOST|nr:hypothetical protein [Dendronalium phyllosphericum]MBH8571808.1 hypothetical protein [Dendronalium phyllosphericum CENA369]